MVSKGSHLEIIASGIVKDSKELRVAQTYKVRSQLHCETVFIVEGELGLYRVIVIYAEKSPPVCALRKERPRYVFDSMKVSEICF